MIIQSYLGIREGMIPGPTEIPQSADSQAPLSSPLHLHLQVQPTMDHVQLTSEQHGFELHEFTYM